MAIEKSTSGIVPRTVYPILITLCAAHFINDLLQIVLQSAFPEFKDVYHLSYLQIGIITLVFQVSSSILQPIVGNYTDKHPMPYSFVIGMGFTLCGIVLLSFANGYIMILLSAGLIGIGSSIFHPESSKLAFYVAGGKRGWAQSIFQIGGNMGTALGPVLFILIVIPNSQQYIAYFAIIAVVGILLVTYIGRWYKRFLQANTRIVKKAKELHYVVSRKKMIRSLVILLILVFSKFFYISSIKSYLLLYLIEKFHFTNIEAQTYLFAYLAAVGIGVLIGGPLGDKFGRKYVIWFSILGVAPFTLLLPFANAFWMLVLLIIIGIILASAFPSIIVYAQELLPGRTGMISGFFYGFAFGMGGIGAAVIGLLADIEGLQQVFIWCAFLPLLGLIAVFLPNLKRIQKQPK